MNLQAIVDEITATLRPQAGQQGQVASYIPALARVRADQFGIALRTFDGLEAAAGDSDVPFSIQSVSKLFSLTLGLQLIGESMWDRIGREPSGNPFNSLVQLEREEGKPRNPFINAGSIAVADRLISQGRTEIDLVAMQCSIRMNCRQLARAAGYLCRDGAHPGGGAAVVSERQARRINALMLTCGTYDMAGEFAYLIGLPCKSGVGGGIVAVVPDRLTLCVWSPALDVSGNSWLGMRALEMFVARTGLSVF